MKKAITIGVFDGVHRGHRALLTAAQATGLSVTALTFDPHPSAVFAPERAPKLLGTLAERTALLHAYGAQEVVVAPFDRDFAAQTPDQFVHSVLVERLSAGAVVVGEDFRFGKDRAGDVDALTAAGAVRGFSVVTVPAVEIEGLPARSTTVRQLLSEGAVEAAARLLGRDYTLSGLVVHGRKLGRTLGYPTANLASEQGVLVPGAGVYAGWAHLPDGREIRAAISVGTNPTVTPHGPVTVEAFLMDGFSEDLYDQRLTLTFGAFLRGMVQFDGLEALITQMARDVERAATLLHQK